MPTSNSIEKLKAVLADKYEIIKLIAAGGMGEIYLGIHRVLGKKRAIKIIHQSVEKEKDIRQRFLQEARHAASVDHPGIIQIMDFGSHDEFDYLIMPYIEGLTLQEKMAQGPIEPETALQLMIAMTDAIAHTHRQNIIHRDIKPSNFMIDTEGRIILTDFGISKNLGDPNMTATNMVLGSPKFMSPEQISGKPVDKRSDLYSLGMIFYQMVTGAYPFESDDMAALAYKQVNEPPPPPARVNPQVPAAVSALIVKLLEKNPDNRYPAGDSLLKDLYRLKEEGLSGANAAAGSGANAIEDMKTRVVAQPSLKSSQWGFTQSAGSSSRSLSGGSRKKKIWLFSGMLICIIGLAVIILNLELIKHHLPVFFEWKSAGLALRSNEVREKEILKELKTHNSSIRKAGIRQLCSLNTGIETVENTDQKLTAELRRFLTAIPYVNYVDEGGCDVLIATKDHALGKKLVITSNLYECQTECSEEFTINPEKVPYDKIELLLKRNYCFNLFKTLKLLKAPKGRGGMNIDIPGKSENVFIIGEQVQFCLEPAFEAHSMLLNINIDGIFKLFPLDRKQRPRLAKNEIGCSKRIQVSPPLGNEMIIAIGCAENEIISGYSQRFDSKLPVFSWSYDETAQNSAIDMSETLLMQLADQDVDTWLAGVRFIRVLNSN